MTLSRLIPSLLCLLVFGLPAAGQSPFAPVVQVNNKVVTQYELDQRVQFMQILRAPGDLEKQALATLIDERLEVQAAENLNISLTEDQIKAGEDEFAQRAKLTGEQFIAEIAKAGIAEQTFRDFVIAGVVWREVIRQRFGSKIEITDAEVDAALSANAPRSDGIKVLISEIILPANTPEATAASQARASEIEQMTSIEEFSQAARDYSAAPSAGRGGRIDWTPVSKLPPGLGPILMALKPGEVTQPFPIPNGIALFQLRAVQDGRAGLPADTQVDYTVVRIPNGSSPTAQTLAARIEQHSDTCSDLFVQVRGQPPEMTQRQTLSMGQIPSPIAAVLNGLDDGEISTTLTQSGELQLVMLCSRTLPLGKDVTRETIRLQLQNQRIGSYAEGYLAELRADAILRYP